MPKLCRALVPSWVNQNLVEMSVNLKLFEPFRDIENICEQKRSRLVAFIDEIVADQVSDLLRSWTTLTFADRFRMLLRLPEIMNFTQLETSASPAFRDLFAQELLFFMLEPTGTGSFRPLSDIATMKPDRIVLTCTKLPAEADFMGRSFAGSLGAVLAIVVPTDTPMSPIWRFTKQLLREEHLGCLVDEIDKYHFEKFLGLRHRCAKLYRSGSDYDTIARGCPAMTYVAEMINGRPHINGDHWFSGRLLALLDTLEDKEARGSIGDIVEEINQILEGRYQCEGIAELRELIAARLRRSGIDQIAPELLTLDSDDFPPGFFQPADAPCR